MDEVITINHTQCQRKSSLLRTVDDLRLSCWSFFSFWDQKIIPVSSTSSELELLLLVGGNVWSQGRWTALQPSAVASNFLISWSVEGSSASYRGMEGGREPALTLSHRGGETWRGKRFYFCLLIDCCSFQFISFHITSLFPTLLPPFTSLFSSSFVFVIWVFVTRFFCPPARRVLS